MFSIHALVYTEIQSFYDKHKNVDENTLHDNLIPSIKANAMARDLILNIILVILGGVFIGLGSAGFMPIGVGISVCVLGGVLAIITLFAMKRIPDTAYTPVSYRTILGLDSVTDRFETKM